MGLKGGWWQTPALPSVPPRAHPRSFHFLFFVSLSRAVIKPIFPTARLSRLSKASIIRLMILSKLFRTQPGSSRKWSSDVDSSISCRRDGCPSCGVLGTVTPPFDTPRCATRPVPLRTPIPAPSAHLCPAETDPPRSRDGFCLPPSQPGTGHFILAHDLFIRLGSIRLCLMPQGWLELTAGVREPATPAASQEHCNVRGGTVKWGA